MTAPHPQDPVGQTDEVAPQASGPAPGLFVGRPMPGPLSTGSLVVRYRVEHLQLVPVLGRAEGVAGIPTGHMVFSVDDLPWHWADASGEPLIVHGLPPGPHRVRMTLVDPDHKPLVAREICFVILETAS